MYLYENVASKTYETWDSAKYLNLNEWTISGWYYTCDSGDYQVMARQSQAAPATLEYVGLRVDGDG
jgi:hypothetical protein